MLIEQPSVCHDLSWYCSMLHAAALDHFSVITSPRWLHTGSSLHCPMAAVRRTDRPAAQVGSCAAVAVSCDTCSSCVHEERGSECSSYRCITTSQLIVPRTHPSSLLPSPLFFVRHHPVSSHVNIRCGKFILLTSVTTCKKSSKCLHKMSDRVVSSINSVSFMP